jgi:hypothetical protein
LRTLKIRLDKIIHRNKRINDNFSQDAPEDMVSLYDPQVGLWNWALPTSPPQSSSNLADDFGLPQASAKEATHKEIFASFLNALANSLAEVQPELAAGFTSRMWSAAKSMVAVPDNEIRCKPDLVLSDNIKPKWGNIWVCAELTSSQYKPAK